MDRVYASPITLIVGVVLAAFGGFHFLKDCIMPHIAALQGGGTSGDGGN